MKNFISFIRLPLMLLIFCLVGSCKTSRDIVAPDPGLPENYAGQSKADTASVAKIPWQVFFVDAELKSLIGDALLKNNDLQIAIKNIESANLTLRQAKLGNIPVVNLQANSAINRPSDNSVNGLTLNQSLQTTHIEDYTVFAALSWEADVWGKIRSRKAAALAAYLGTEEARKTVQSQLVNDVSKGYYNLLMLDSQVEIARKNVLLNDSTLNIIKLQFQAGQVTSLAVQQAAAQKLTSAALVPQFEQQIVVQENAISVLCGRLPSTIKRGFNLQSLTIEEAPGTGIPSELLSRRPDVKQAELALSRANAEVGYAKANLYPSFSITAQGGLDAFKASNWFNIPASLFGTVLGGIAQPIFQQRRLATLYNISKVKREQTVLEFRQSVLVAVRDVSDALAKIEKLKQQQNFVAQRTGTLQVATQNSQLLFKNGLANYLEVITAQANVLQSELELASIKKAQLDASVDLYHSLGGGWN